MLIIRNYFHFKYESLLLKHTKQIIMKKLIIVLLALAFFTCKNEPVNYATLSGKIENADKSKTLKIYNDSFEKLIVLNEDGTFSDTLKVEGGEYRMKHGNQYGTIFLKNNNTTTLHTDYEDFDKTLVFGGDDADINNLSIQSYLITENYFTPELMTTDSDEVLDAAVKNYESAYEELKNKYPKVDTANVASVNKSVASTVKSYRGYIASMIAIRKELPTGSPSPTFVSYENNEGETTSLSDLKGKYVYMDIWATWCGPCKAEIPYLKKVEKKYHNKNIEFVSISVDDGRGYKGDANAAKEGWKKMIADKTLGGVQLLADNGFKSTFIQDYKINGIPRFILVDPDGNIVNADAPRPSSDQLIKLFDELKI